MRRLLKRLLYMCGYIFHSNHKSKIIYYHDVGTAYTDMGTDIAIIKKHFDCVRKSGYKFVESINAPLDQVMVCFDDGWEGIYLEKDFFISERVYPTIFIAVELIGKPGYLTLEQILELQSFGFHFEGHTWSHQDLTISSEADLRHELADSKQKLSEMLGKEVTAICFPKGRFSDEVLRISHEAGYQKLYSSISGGYYDMMADKKLICRNLVQSVTGKEFFFVLNSTSTFFVKRTQKLHYKR